jgi:hypothetical protein
MFSIINRLSIVNHRLLYPARTIDYPSLTIYLPSLTIDLSLLSDNFPYGFYSEIEEIVVCTMLFGHEGLSELPSKEEAVSLSRNTYVDLG